MRRKSTPHKEDLEAQAIEECTELMAPRRGGRFQQEVNAATTINVYFHVITSTSGAGNVSDATIAAQMTVLNDSFSNRTGGAATRFAFNLVATDRTANDAWYTTTGGASEMEMKTALRRGGAGD